jgi:hypothetical protein
MFTEFSEPRKSSIGFGGSLRDQGILSFLGIFVTLGIPIEVLSGRVKLETHKPSKCPGSKSYMKLETCDVKWKRDPSVY